jgi:hypothetical protein
MVLILGEGRPVGHLRLTAANRRIVTAMVVVWVDRRRDL